MTENPFEVLTGIMGFPGSKYLRQIFEYLMSPSQAEVATALPGSVEEVAARARITKEEARKILDELWRKGLAFPKDFDKRDYFRFARDIVQLHDATLATQQLGLEKDKKYFELWHEFGIHEFYKKMGEMLEAVLTKPFWRVIPAYQAIKDLPDVLPHENMHEIVEEVGTLGIVPCSCRQVTAALGKGCDHTDETKVWHCTQFGRGAEYVIKRGSGRQISKEEIIELMDEIERDGLVHMGPNTSDISRIRTICNCCSDCCEFFNFFRFGKIPIGVMVEKSRFEAWVDVGKCTGCQTCIERCYFDAISFVRPADSKRYKAQVNSEKCFGCGVCAIGCEQEAIKLKLVRSPEHIPTD